MGGRYFSSLWRPWPTEGFVIHQEDNDGVIVYKMLGFTCMVELDSEETMSKWKRGL